MVNIWNALFRAINSVTSKYDPLILSLLKKNQELQDRVKNLELSKNSVYSGRELSEFTWAELKAIATSGTATEHNIFVGDYKTITMNENTVKMQIAGIDTYWGTYKTAYQQLGHHIDFISKDCYPEPVEWNTTGTNNGTADQPKPYLASSLYTWLNETLYGYLPSDVKEVIIEKVSSVESRYSSSEILVDSTSWADGGTWGSMGKLWVPTEYEVFGSIIGGTRGFSQGQPVQYPIFANSWLARFKNKGDGGSKCNWWLSTVYSGNSTSACFVDSKGHSNAASTSNSLYVPVCFRIE